MKIQRLLATLVLSLVGTAASALGLAPFVQFQPVKNGVSLTIFRNNRSTLRFAYLLHNDLFSRLRRNSAKILTRFKRE